MLEISQRQVGDRVYVETIRGEVCQLDVLDPAAGRVTVTSTVPAIQDGTHGIVSRLEMDQPFEIRFGNGAWRFGAVCGMSLAGKGWQWEFPSTTSSS